MRLTLKIAALGMVLAFGMTACSDDSGTTPTPDQGMKKDGMMTPDGTTPTPDGTTPTPDGAAAGACTSATDKANVGKQYGGKTLTELISAQAACLLDPNPKTCLVNALKTATNSEITEPCLGCFADSALCSATNCAVCIADATSAACKTCRCGDNPAKINCVKTYEDCSGLTSDVTCN
jgi:hypothetical protein